jgi:hypothetical protein
MKFRCNKCKSFLLGVKSLKDDETGEILCEQCFQIDRLKDKIKQLNYEAEKKFSIDFSKIIGYSFEMKTKGKMPNKIYLSGEYYAEIMKDRDIRTAIYHNETYGITELFGMEIIIRDDIIGWYLEAKK